MVNNYVRTVQQPMIVKYVQSSRNGIQSHNLARNAVGYVVRGKKYIYNGDMRIEVDRGDLFYMSAGLHYIEDIPEGNKPFEQILFYYTPEELSNILNSLSINYHLCITNDHSCPNCHNKSYVVYPGWSTLRNFVSTVSQYIKDDVFSHDETAACIKMTELMYLILSNKDCCLKGKILSNIDTDKESFEQIINRNIFNDVSIEELASQCNRSLTSFKKEFRKHFYEPPHKWFIKQRLMHSRLLLISTNKSISEIGVECSFPNTSHFIKLFKKEYEMTPAAYRQCHQQPENPYYDMIEEDRTLNEV